MRGVALLSFASTSAVVLLVSTALLAVFFLFVYRQKRQTYMLAWSAGWLLTSFHVLSTALLTAAPHSWSEGLNDWLLVVSALVFYAAARLYARLPIATNILAGVAAIAVAWAFVFVKGFWGVPLSLGGVLIFFMVAQVFWQEGRKQESRADVLLATTFAIWGLICVAMAFRRRLGLTEQNDLIALTWLPQLFAGVLMVTVVYEEERRRVERNMIALSNLNLATSGVSGGGIHKMLAQALDRVLNVVRIPAGALCLNRSTGDDGTTVVVTGLNSTFVSAVQQGDLHEYLVGLVARLGGLVVLRNLASDSEYKGLEKEDAFRRIRELLLAENLRTVVGISLQAKEQTFGVLLLAT